MISPDASVVADAANERHVDALVAARNALVSEKSDLERRVGILVNDNDLACHVITAFVERFAPDEETWVDIISRVMVEHGVDRNEVVDFLTPLDVLPDEILYQEFYVQISVPMYLTVSVQARDSDHACELASDMIGGEWPQSIVDSYDWDLDLYGLCVNSVEEA